MRFATSCISQGEIEPGFQKSLRFDHTVSISQEYQEFLSLYNNVFGLVIHVLIVPFADY